MAKELGQIHTVNYTVGGAVHALANDTFFLIDLPGQLTLQLQHMVRMMQSFKLVGIDLSISPVTNADPMTASASGLIKYYVPTKGRVQALQMAYKSVRRMMKLSGVKPENAINYDFRPPIANPATFLNGDEFFNQATVEDNGLATCLANGPGSSNVFGIWNQGVQPRHALGINQWNPEEGFDIGLRTNAASADWTLNEGVYLQATTVPTANEDFEFIPFDIAYTSASQSAITTDLEGVATPMEWRPDPALYLAILTGQLIVQIDTVTAFDAEDEIVLDEVEIDMAFHVAGWKSILSSDRKRRTKTKKVRHHGRRRRRSKK